MFDDIVVGVEDYEAGRDALGLAKALASGAGQITLVYVEVLQSEPAADGRPRSDAERQRFGLERLRRLRDDVQVAAEVARVQAHSVRRGLHGLAASRAADLIVIGASRRNDVARALLGDDVHAVLDAPPCPVAVAPAAYSAGSAPITTIGVAYDGSAESEHALAVARKLAAQRHAALSAFDSIPPPVYVGDHWNAEGERQEDVEQARQRLAALGGLEARAECAADPVEALRRYGASVDLLVIASDSPDEHDLPRRVFKRSKSQRLADRPSSPLLVVGAGVRERSPTAQGSHGAE